MLQDLEQAGVGQRPSAEIEQALTRVLQAAIGPSSTHGGVSEGRHVRTIAQPNGLSGYLSVKPGTRKIRAGPLLMAKDS